MVSHSARSIAIIPARGGSKGIPRKNVRQLNGKPLIWYSIHTARESGCFEAVVVSTDDDEIAHVAQEAGAQVHRRPESLGGDRVTLDPVIHDVVANRPEEFDLVATLQPTSPLLKPETLRRAMERMIEDPSIETLVSVVNDPRLSWIEKEGTVVPNYTERLNRQQLPPLYRETGSVFISRRSCVTPASRFGRKVEVFELPREEAIDIDSKEDWWVAEKRLRARRIALRVDASRQIGFGHVSRMLLLASRLLDHEIRFFVDEDLPEGARAVENSFYPLTLAKATELPACILDFRPDIAILDILDTTPEQVRFFKQAGVYTVTFEDLGPGMVHADLVVNALYESDIPYPHVFSGPEYYCLREEFAHTEPKPLAPQVGRIVATFGGADPSNLTQKTFEGLVPILKEGDTHLRIILGLGYPQPMEAELGKSIEKAGVRDRVEIFRNVRSMAMEFKQADLVLTSCGRTMYEVASLGVPAILMAQNDREMHHHFGQPSNGFSFLGLGSEVSLEELREAIETIRRDYSLRLEMRRRMLKWDFRAGLDRVIALILDRYEATRTVRDYSPREMEEEKS
jgi:CMP-N-acetylneuraminic acid synthetase/spore coat polysaccharide biosynthesis predicted glycosyltransferase SpsG